MALIALSRGAAANGVWLAQSAHHVAGAGSGVVLAQRGSGGGGVSAV